MVRKEKMPKFSGFRMTKDGLGPPVYEVTMTVAPDDYGVSHSATNREMVHGVFNHVNGEIDALRARAEAAEQRAEAAERELAQAQAERDEAAATAGFAAAIARTAQAEAERLRSAIAETLRLADIYAGVAAHNAEAEPETAGEAWRSPYMATMRELRRALRTAP